MKQEKIERKQKEKAILKKLEYLNAEIKTLKLQNDYCSDYFRKINEERNRLWEELNALKQSTYRRLCICKRSKS